jgi:sulfur carrier protein
MPIMVIRMGSMTLDINGESRTVPAAANVAELIYVLGIPPGRIAVEVNGKIIRRGEWEQTAISNHDRVEIIQFVGGG